MFDGHGKERKRRKEKSEFVEDMPLLSQDHWEDYKHRQEWLKKKRQTAKADIVKGLQDTYVLTAFVDNTYTDKEWILDSDSVIYVCFKECSIP